MPTAILPTLRRATALAAFLTTAAFAQNPPFIEGVHYDLLDETQAVQTGDKIEVVELFWYGCPHCYSLEPYIERWLANKPDNAEMVAMPVAFNKRWEENARMYYTLEALGRIDDLHSEMFDTIHRLKRPMNTEAQFTDWAVEHGMERDAVTAAYRSFAVENKISRVKLMMRNYGITGVPSIIVDGRYRTSVSLAGSEGELLEVINYLVELAARERAG